MGLEEDQEIGDIRSLICQYLTTQTLMDGFCVWTEEDMTEAVVVAMKGDALRWYQWENKRRLIRNLVNLKDFVLRQFRPSASESLYE